MAKRSRKSFFVMLTMFGLMALGLGVAAFWPRAPRLASESGQAAPLGSPGSNEARSIEELQREAADRQRQNQGSQEWLWARQGETDKVIQSYRQLKTTGSEMRDQHLRIIQALARNFQVRKQWPPAFNDEKARQVVEFLASLLKSDQAGPELIAAAEALQEIAAKYPEAYARVEESFLELYARDTRPGIRGQSVLALGRIRSVKGLLLIQKAALATDGAVSRAALYGLDFFANTPHARQAFDVLAKAAHENPPARPLAVKLLAKNGDRRAVDFAKGMLGPKASPAEVETAAYVATKFKLRGLRELLESTAASNAHPYAVEQARAALGTLAK